MPKVLLLGYSRIARRRILPALASVGVEEIDIASVSSPVVERPGRLNGVTFRNYETALDESDADIAYVSTMNSLHARLTSSALQRGFHVVVDKPAFLQLDEALRLVQLAASRNLCLAEATVYCYHPRISAAVQVFEHLVPSHIIAIFTFPPLPASDFRYQAMNGDGAAADLGPYALTPARLFFRARSSVIECYSLAQQNGVTTSFALLSVYPGGRSLCGVFGYNTEYANRLEILGADRMVTMDCPFTPPADKETELLVRQANETHSIIIAPADTFAQFLRSLFAAIAAGNVSVYGATLVEDAVEREALLRAIKCTT